MIELAVIMGDWSCSSMAPSEEPYEIYCRTVLPRDKRGKHSVISSQPLLVKAGPIGEIKQKED